MVDLNTPLIDRGLDLSKPDELSAEERAAFEKDYTRLKGHVLPAFDFWVENRPDVLKRYRLMARHTPEEAELGTGLPSVLAFLAYYAIVGYDDGILYEIILAQTQNANKDQILATLAVAFLHAGPRGSRYIATSSQEYLRTYKEPTEPGRFPAGWQVDPDAFISGVDFSTPELLAGEQELIEEWYMRVSGEVPPWVRFLGRYRPNLLKAFRHRFEYAIKDAMPAQAMPFFQLYWNVVRGFAPGIREAALMGRGLGMTRQVALEAITRAMIYAGPAGMDIAESAAGAILDDWDD